MSAVSARFASALSRLLGAFGDTAEFRGASVAVLIDTAPKPERLPANMLDLDEGVQAAILTLPFSAVPPGNPPSVGEYFAAGGMHYRIRPGIRHLGHAYELPCTAHRPA